MSHAGKNTAAGTERRADARPSAVPTMVVLAGHGPLARQSVSHKLMFVGPVTRDDVRFLKKESFLPDLLIFGTTELKLCMARESEA